MDGSPPGSSVHEISKTRILEWVAIAFSNTTTREAYMLQLQKALILQGRPSTARQKKREMNIMSVGL